MADRYTYISFYGPTFVPPGSTSILGRQGLGPDIKFGGEIWGKVQTSSPNKGKNLGLVWLPKDAKVRKEFQFLGHI